MEENKKPEPRWYVIHTYSGYENKVKQDIEHVAKARGIQDLILEVKYPVEEVRELKDGKSRTVSRKRFPGYVMVKMIKTDETWYMGIEYMPIEIDIEVGETVRIIQGPFENFLGRVIAVDKERQKIKLIVNLMGKDAPTELDFFQVQKL
jgi:transcriptional antiterminator NusG